MVPFHHKHVHLDNDAKRSLELIKTFHDYRLVI